MLGVGGQEASWARKAEGVDVPGNETPCPCATHFQAGVRYLVVGPVAEVRHEAHGPGAEVARAHGTLQVPHKVHTQAALGGAHVRAESCIWVIHTVSCECVATTSFRAVWNIVLT